MPDIIKNDCQGEHGDSNEALRDRKTFSKPIDTIPMTDQYDWRCFIHDGPWFLCRDGFPLRDSSNYNTEGWRVCAVEIGREKSIVKFAAEIATLKAELEEAKEIIGKFLRYFGQPVGIDLKELGYDAYVEHTVIRLRIGDLIDARAFLKEKADG